MVRVHGSQPHPANCDKLVARDANRTSYPSARTMPPFGALAGSEGAVEGGCRCDSMRAGREAGPLSCSAR
jgi:hypothetical protein